ncbi:MAG TPA: hypothetical protein PK523_01060 [Elusimicrobiales bacterium]|mgnify:CR=1 FL=1|nr:hypothetical protein [Elusimicrobiales bacterium]
MNKKIVSPFFLLAAALPLCAQQQLPVLDTEFGIKPFSMDVPGQEADALVAVAQSADGAFYAAGGNTLTRLDSAGNRLWSRYYLPYDDPYAFAQGSISTDDGNNVYVGLVALSEGYAHILKYGPDGTLLKDYTWPAQGAAVYGTALNKDTGRLYAVFLDDSLRIAMLDTDLNLLDSVSHDASAIVPAPGVGMDKEGNIYAGGWVYPGQNEYFAVKYSPDLDQLFEFFEPVGPDGSEFGILDAYGTGVYPGGFYLSAWEYEAGGGGGSGYTGIVNISSYGAKNWESVFAAPFMEYSPSGTDNAGNFYGAGYTEDWTPQFTKLDSDTGGAEWSVPESHSCWIGGVIAGGGNALYTAGELMESSGTEYYYITRYTLGGDGAAPAAIADLTAATVSSGSVTLAWTAPGDDGTAGTAAAYDLRYTTAGPIIEDAAFGSATPVPGVPAPQAAGTPETFTVTGLLAGTTYFFGIKTADEAGNVSGLSNPAEGVTAAVPAVKYSLSKSAGDDQIIAINAWSGPLVGLVNIFGTTIPANGIGVDFSISTFPAGAEGFALSKSSESTNPQGHADVLLRLGNIPAEYGVTATCNTCEPSASSVTFTCCGKLPNNDFKQFDDRWKDTHYDNICSTVPAGRTGRPVYSCDAAIFNNPQYQKHEFTISAKGCGLSALATLINHYKDAYSLPISSATPAILNSYMNENSGYDKGGSVFFNKVADWSNNRIVYVRPKIDIGQLVNGARTTRDDLMRLVKTEVMAKRPVIVRISSGHFLLVVGLCGDDYIVSDPGSGWRYRYNPIGALKLIGVRRFEKL